MGGLKIMRDKLGLNFYLPQTELSEKESLYYNINLNQKRKCLWTNNALIY